MYRQALDLTLIARERESSKCLCILHEDAFIACAMSENLSVICNIKTVTKYLQKQELGRKARWQSKDLTESKRQGSRNRVLELNVYSYKYIFVYIFI